MKQHILVVDDETPILELLSAFFGGQDFKVSTAAGGLEALRAIEDIPPDLVLLDIMMSESDGLEILGEIKASHPNLPVIIMTGAGFDDELRHGAVEKGASGFVGKTSPLDKFLLEVQRTLRKK